MAREADGEKMPPEYARRSRKDLGNQRRIAARIARLRVIPLGGVAATTSNARIALVRPPDRFAR